MDNNKYAQTENQVSFRNSGWREERLVSVIILNFNGRGMLRKCLQSVSKTNYPNYEVIVVDNCSTDGSCAMVEEEFPHVQVIKNSENFLMKREFYLNFL